MRLKNLNSSVWSIADVLIYPVLYLLFTPFFIKHLGVELYGIWMIVNTIIVFMQVFNFGIGLNTQRNIAIAIGQNNKIEIPKIINVNLSFAFLIAIFCICLGIVFAQYQNHFDFFGISKNFQQTALFSISLSGSIVGVKFIEQIFTNTLIAYERIALVSRYNIILRLIVLFGAIFLIVNDVNIVFIFVFNLCAFITAIAILYSFVLQSTNSFKLNFCFSKLLFLKEFDYSKWIWMQSVFVIIAFQCDKFLIAHWLGVSSFSYYSIVSTIFNHLHLALMAVAPWAIPQITKLFAAGKSYNQYYFSMRSLIHIICYVGIAVFYFTFSKLFTLWLGAAYLSEIQNYIKLFMAFQLLFVFTITPFYLLNAIGKGKLATINTFIYSTLSLIGVYSGYSLFQNAKGLLLGLIVGVFIAIFVQQLILGQQLKFNRFWESIGLMSPMATLSLFILMEDYSITFRVILLFISLILFIYIYFFKYPVGFQQLRAVSNVQISSST